MRGVLLVLPVVLTACVSFSSEGVATSRDGAVADGGGDDAGIPDAAGPDAGDPADADVPADMVDRGLLTRYFIDEAGSGTGPSLLMDSAADPLPLALAYDGGEPVFVEIAGNRGLRWTELGNDGFAGVLLNGTKVHTALDGATAATVEVVLSVEATDPDGSRFSHIGVGADSYFSLESHLDSRVEFHWEGQVKKTSGRWNLDLPSRGRFVAHMVFDTTQNTPRDRLRLYVDGQEVPSNTQDDPLPGDTVTLPGGALYYVLGNREVGGRTFRGTLFYAALYGEALTAQEVAANAARLLVDDDQ